MINKRYLVFFAHFFGVSMVLKSLNFILPHFVSCWYTCIAHMLLFVYVLNISYELTKKKFLKDRIQPYNKAVLITGCDTGFGHEFAKRLDRLGFHVFAACLFPSGKGAENLKSKCSDHLQIVGLDVTKDESVKKAVEFVKSHLDNCELWAIVNNAGILKGTLADMSSLEDYKANMEVNAFGTVRVTKAFLPTLKRSKGRVVNVTSILAPIPTPYISPYVMSKCASHGFTNSIRQELDFWGVKVISVEPDFFRTALADPEVILRSIDSSIVSAEQDVLQHYEENQLKAYRAISEFLLRFSSQNVAVVINALESAVCLKYPDSSYRASRNLAAQVVFYFGERLPRYLVDLPFKILQNCRNFFIK